jgi:hypothetical protein
LRGALATNAKVTVVTGAMESRFEEFGRWSLAEYVRNGRGYTFGTQGTVIHTSEWAGSRHENSEVISASLTVDGVEQELTHGSVYEGDTAVMRRTTVLDGVMQLDAVMTLTENCITEQVTFTMLQSHTISIFYGLQYAYDKRFDAYKSFDADGNLLKEGNLGNYDGDYYHLSKADGDLGYIESRYIAWFDPISEDAIFASFEASTHVRLDPTVVDRWDSNKLYYRLRAKETYLLAGHTFDVTMVTEFPHMTGEAWDAFGGVAAIAPEPATGLLLAAGVLVGIARRRRRRSA